MLVLGVGGGLRELAGRLEIRLAGGIAIDAGLLWVYPIQARQDASHSAHHVIERAIFHDQHDDVTNGIVVWHRFPSPARLAAGDEVFYNGRRVPTIGGES